MEPQANHEVLVMNDYDDIIFEDEPRFLEFVKQEYEDESSDFNIEENEIEDAILNNRELKLEEQEVCDVDTKQNILLKFEEENADNSITKKTEEVGKINAENKKFICYQCGFRALKKHYLQSHIQQFHINKKEVPTSFDCEYCMFKTKYKHSLPKHMAAFHMDKIQKNNSIDTGRKKSCYDVQKMNIQGHCTVDKDNNFKCNYCSHTASNIDLISKHLPTHTVSKSKVLQCSWCPKEFTKSVLQRHIKQVHITDGVLRCPKCPFKTSWNSNLRRHFKRNKDRKTCKEYIPRRTPKELELARLQGKAPPVGKRRKKSDGFSDIVAD